MSNDVAIPFARMMPVEVVFYHVATCDRSECMRAGHMVEFNISAVRSGISFFGIARRAPAFGIEALLPPGAIPDKATWDALAPAERTQFRNQRDRYLSDFAADCKAKQDRFVRGIK
jgi:hypothetical protein